LNAHLSGFIIFFHNLYHFDNIYTLNFLINHMYIKSKNNVNNDNNLQIFCTIMTIVIHLSDYYH